MGLLHFNDVWMWCRAARVYLVVDKTNKGEPATSGSHIKYTTLFTHHTGTHSPSRMRCNSLYRLKSLYHHGTDALRACQASLAPVAALVIDSASRLEKVRRITCSLSASGLFRKPGGKPAWSTG